MDTLVGKEDSLTLAPSHASVGTRRVASLNCRLSGEHPEMTEVYRMRAP